MVATVDQPKAPARFFFWDCLISMYEWDGVPTHAYYEGDQILRLMTAYTRMIEHDVTVASLKSFYMDCHCFHVNGDQYREGSRTGRLFNEAISEVAAMGAEKHGQFSYRNEMDINLIIDAMGRHLLQIVEGHQVDHLESNLTHISHMGANILIAIYQLTHYLGEEKQNDK